MKLAAVAAKLLQGLVCLLLLATLAVPVARAQDQAQPAAAAAPSFDEIKAALDDAEAAIDDDAVGADKLAELRQKINDLACQLHDKLAEIEPRAGEIAERVKQLGPPPAKDAPAESEDIANERKELTDDASELDGDVKQARLLLLRADQLSERVSEKRHSLYARELFARTQSILDPHFWLDASNALPVEWRRLDGMIASWLETMRDHANGASLIAAALGLAVILLLIYFASRWIRPKADTPRDALARVAGAARVHRRVHMAGARGGNGARDRA